MSIFFCFFIYKHIYQYKCHLLFYNINIFSFMLIAKTVRDNFNSLNFIRVSPPVSITPPLSLYSIVNNVVCGFQLPKKKKKLQENKKFRGVSGAIWQDAPRSFYYTANGEINPILYRPSADLFLFPNVFTVSSERLVFLFPSFAFRTDEGAKKFSNNGHTRLN